MFCSVYGQLVVCLHQMVIQLLGFNHTEHLHFRKRRGKQLDSAVHIWRRKKNKREKIAFAIRQCELTTSLLLLNNIYHDSNFFWLTNFPDLPVFIPFSSSCLRLYDLKYDIILFSRFPPFVTDKFSSMCPLFQYKNCLKFPIQEKMFCKATCLFYRKWP